jgi:hypothetical protein
MFQTLAVSKDYLLAMRHLVKLNPADEESVEGKIVIITGANSGNLKCVTCDRELDKS